VPKDLVRIHDKRWGEEQYPLHARSFRA